MWDKASKNNNNIIWNAIISSAVFDREQSQEFWSFNIVRITVNDSKRQHKQL
jgi:hypothetical protein